MRNFAQRERANTRSKFSTSRFKVGTPLPLLFGVVFAFQFWIARCAEIPHVEKCWSQLVNLTSSARMSVQTAMLQSVAFNRGVTKRSGVYCDNNHGLVALPVQPKSLRIIILMNCH